jgi:hypothetical protein
MVLRRIPAHKGEEDAGGWKKFYSKKFHVWYSTSCVIRLIRTGTVRWVEHVARMGKTYYFRGLFGKPE